MRVICFSSFTFSYLDRARVLAQTVRRHHPEWRFVAVITDTVPPGFDFDLADEAFDEVVWGQELVDDWGWLFRHDVVEVCTAVKGPALVRFLDQADAVIYLDPDTAVFAPLTPLIELLEQWDVVFTPHQLAPDDEDMAIIDNEICSLQTGTYNLGFVAVRARGDGLSFARWWADRLMSYCYDELENGLFVDQRWCDLAPALFANVKILRDPGYNVASWNLSRRKITIEKSGQILVNGSILRFWHFTKLGPLGDTMTRRYAQDNFEVYELWGWYRDQVMAARDPAIPAGYWAFGKYASGEPIAKAHRLLYRRRHDLQIAFPDPFADGTGSFPEWLASQKQPLVAG